MNPRTSLRPWADRPVEPATSSLAGRLLWIAVLLMILGLLLSTADAATSVAGPSAGCSPKLLQTGDFPHEV